MSLKQNSTTWIWVLGFASTIVYALILKISFSFELSSTPRERPVLLMLGLFGLAFFAYFTACYFVLGTKGNKNDVANDSRDGAASRDRSARSIAVIFLFGIIFRLILLFSTPILEVDIYRYVWDGLTTNQGVDPYQYPPYAVIWDVDALKRSPNSEPSWPGITPPTLNQDMEQLVRLAATHDGVEKVLRQVHFSQFTTVYPPVSQGVFAVALRAMPLDSSASRFIFATKTAIVLFDLGTAVLVVLLLAKIGLPLTWSIVYCWCPLLLKEFANSGHLDSIAVFFFAAGIVATVYGLTGDGAERSEFRSGRNLRCLIWFSLAGIALALAVGAKFYPVIIVPLWTCACLKHAGWRGGLALAIFFVVSATACWPMARHTEIVRKYYPSVVPESLQRSFTLPRKPEIKTRQPYPVGQYPSGIEIFLDSWEMNDLLFMIVVENLKISQPALPGTKAPRVPWFSVVDQDLRIDVAEAIRGWTGKQRSAFWVTRRVTLAVFAIIVLWSCVSVIGNGEPENFCRLSFLTVAWFWLLSPTQNPWYWSWALPLVVFAHSRVWLAVAAATMLYYLRFYFEYHFAGQAVLGTPYEGVRFFDFVVPWIEFGPLLIMLFLVWIYRRKNSRSYVA